MREKARKEDKYYKDAKYVKMAGNIAYNGVLIALDVLFREKKNGRKIEWYQAELGKMEKNDRIINSHPSQVCGLL